MCASDPAEFPAYSFVPGGPWPHPARSRQVPSPGHERRGDGEPGVISPQFLWGVRLFNAGYYWEAHEVWEGLWHAHGRCGTKADLLRGLIKLAAAGVKVREGQEHGVRVHAHRAAELFARVRQEAGRHQLGLDLEECIERARAVAANPPVDPIGREAPVSVVFNFCLVCTIPGCAAS
jgi:hypothetical protein